MQRTNLRSVIRGYAAMPWNLAPRMVAPSSRAVVTRTGPLDQAIQNQEYDNSNSSYQFYSFSKDRNIFAFDSTFLLMKKFFVYKLMGSDLFINHALTGMDWSYRVLGKTLTNFGINVSVGSLFTAGSSLASLEKDIVLLRERNVGGIANYVVEGIEEWNEDFINEVHSSLISAVDTLTQQNQEAITTEGHLAIKLTSMINIQLMTKVSRL